MVRAVLDANVFVSALIRPEGPPGKILTLLLRDLAFDLVVSAAIIEEIKRSLSYPRVRKYVTASEKEIELWVAAVELVADHVEAKVKVAKVEADPEDNKYLAAALEGRAEFVVSGDHDLLSLKEYQGVRILSPQAFLEVLRERRS